MRNFEVVFLVALFSRSKINRNEDLKTTVETSEI